MQASTQKAVPTHTTQTKPASGAGASGSASWKSFAEGLGGAGAKIPGYSLGLLKNAITSVGGVVLPGWSMRRIGWVAGAGTLCLRILSFSVLFSRAGPTHSPIHPHRTAGFVIGFFVGKKFGGVHVHLTTPALPP